MIIKETMYAIGCDRCEKTLNWETLDPRWYNTNKEATDAAKSYGWVFCESGCVCAECMTEIIANQ